MKKVFYIIFMSFLLSGCICINNKKFYLENKYYEKAEKIKITTKEFKQLKTDNESFIIFINNSSCTATQKFCEILDEVLNTYNLTIYEISFSDIKETTLSNYVKYTPSIAIYKKGKYKSSLDASKEKHYIYYDTVDGLKSYITKYVLLK